MTSWTDLRALTRAELAAGGIGPADSEARWMVERVSGHAGAELTSGEVGPATAAATARVREMVSRRLAGEPLQYVLGEWSFCGLDVYVDHRVLAPRPETEVTASAAIEEATRLGLRLGPIADLGTGSGVIALALADALPNAEIWATDVSDDALRVAAANLSGAGSFATRIRLAQGSWYDALPEELWGRLGLIVSNPPYVSADEHPALPDEVREHEPRQALVAGSSGLEAIAAIVRDAPGWLAPCAGIVVELAPHQAERALTLAREAGLVEAEVRPDLTGRGRVLVARRAG